MRRRKQYRCRFCGAVFNAWLPAAERPDGALMLGHVSQRHPDEVGRYLDQMRGSDDIGMVAAQAFELVEGDETGGTGEGKGEGGEGVL
jgi:hypothetical protein